MISLFPEFKPLELADRVDIDAASSGFPPYSDFNFTNLHAWDTQGAMRLSRLYNNIVLQFTDYLSEKPFFAFLGNHRATDTAKALLAFADAEYKTSALRFIPEEVAQTVAADGLVVTQDHAATDYVYAVDHLANMDQWVGRRSRSRIRQFTDRYPDYAIRRQPLASIDISEFRTLHMNWGHSKGIATPEETNEYRAFERFLHLPSDTDVVSLYVDGQLVGFSSFEIVRNDTALIHFSKTNSAIHPGICDLLYWEEARILHAEGITHANWEQDLGLPGLRHFKMRFEPCHFLKKFTVSSPL